MEKYTSQQDPDNVLDNISIKSDDTDFLLSSDANDVLESINYNTEMPEFDGLTTCTNKIGAVEETQIQSVGKDFDFPNNYNTNREYNVTEDNLDFVQRLRFGNEYKENLDNGECPNILMNSMNENEVKEFGKEIFVFISFSYTGCVYDNSKYF